MRMCELVRAQRAIMLSGLASTHVWIGVGSRNCACARACDLRPRPVDHTAPDVVLHQSGQLEHGAAMARYRVRCAQLLKEKETNTTDQ